jgi:Holliday junction resolvase RusA-like endonuclease
MREYEVPYPPSVNHYWRHVGPRVLVSREGRRFRSRVGQALAAAGAVPLNGPLGVKIEVFPPDNRRRDLDNTLKALLDALGKGGAYHDDSQIVWLTIRKCRPVVDGRVIVRIAEIGELECRNSSPPS